MSGFEVRCAHYRDRILESFARQSFLQNMKADITHIAPGEVDIRLARQDGLQQQHGFFHAGVSTTLADSAAGYAAYSLFAEGDGVLSSEFKINLLNPGRGDFLLARGRVIKPGKTLTICRGDVYGLSGDHDRPVETHVATGLFTMMRMEGLEA